MLRTFTQLCQPANKALLVAADDGHATLTGSGTYAMPWHWHDCLMFILPSHGAVELMPRRSPRGHLAVAGSLRSRTPGAGPSDPRRMRHSHARRRLRHWRRVAQARYRGRLAWRIPPSHAHSHPRAPDRRDSCVARPVVAQRHGSLWRRGHAPGPVGGLADAVHRRSHHWKNGAGDLAARAWHGTGRRPRSLRDPPCGPGHSARRARRALRHLPPTHYASVPRRHRTSRSASSSSASGTKTPVGCSPTRTCRSAKWHSASALKAARPSRARCAASATIRLPICARRWPVRSKGKARSNARRGVDPRKLTGWKHIPRSAGLTPSCLHVIRSNSSACSPPVPAAATRRLSWSTQPACPTRKCRRWRGATATKAASSCRRRPAPAATTSFASGSRIMRCRCAATPRSAQSGCSIKPDACNVTG